MSRVRTFARMAALGGAAALGVFAFAPSAFAATSANASPNTGLADAQTITLSGAGFPAGLQQIQAEECQGSAAAPPTSNASCDAISLDSTHGTDASGAYSNTAFTVLQLGVPGTVIPSSNVVCNGVKPCVIYLGTNQNDFTQPHAWADISFGTQAALPESPLVPLLPVGGALILFGGGAFVLRNGRRTSKSAA